MAKGKKNASSSRKRSKKKLKPWQSALVTAAFVLGVPLLLSLLMALAGVVLNRSFGDFFADLLGYWIAALVILAFWVLREVWQERRENNQKNRAKQLENSPEKNS